MARKVLFACLGLAACEPSIVEQAPDRGEAPELEARGEPPRAAGFAPPRHTVFVIAFENHDSIAIYGNHQDAPTINDVLMPEGAAAMTFGDVLPTLPSEPHYLWMEGGRNAYDDHTFTSDADPSSSNSTAETAHLVNQIEDAGLTWMSYQEGLDERTGACPVTSAGFYAAKHDPFVFFQDVAGNPPSPTAERCARHHRPLAQLTADLAAGNVADYVFITPDLCHDMHGATGCPDPNLIRSGDDWLAANLGPVLDHAAAHDSVVFLTWDEGNDSELMPFLVLGPLARAGTVSQVRYDHSAQVKGIERILGLPILPSVEAASELDELFLPGRYPP